MSLFFGLGTMDLVEICQEDMMTKQMTAAEMGRKGGSVRGPSKRRGDSAHYRALVNKRYCQECGHSHRRGVTCNRGRYPDHCECRSGIA